MRKGGEFKDDDRRDSLLGRRWTLGGANTMLESEKTPFPAPECNICDRKGITMKDKAVVITGAGSGIGRAIVKTFASAGASILAVGRTETNIEETREMVADLPGCCRTFAGDIGRKEDVTGIMQAALDAYGKVDVLINNAAQAVTAKTADMGFDDFDCMLNTNAAGTFYMCHEVWGMMKKNGGGIIINISSMAGSEPFPGLVAYGATKAFVNMLTKGLAEEGRKAEISVFAIAPGTVETRMLRSSFPDFPAEKTLDPEDVAKLALTLCDPACRYSTGEVISIRK